MAPTKKATKAKMDDWISSLAKQASSSEAVILPKEQRKQKRAAKKARRNQTKPVSLNRRDVAATTMSTDAIDKLKMGRNRRRLKKLAKTLQTIQSHLPKKESKHPRPYSAPNSNKLSKHKRKKKQWNQETIQPRPCDYSGIGLARESLFVSFLDPSYVPKIEEEFRQHIPGFYGKQRTKAMKRQLDGNMLWRQLAERKQKLPKKFQSMSPDERVEAMIESGMV